MPALKLVFHIGLGFGVYGLWLRACTRYSCPRESTYLIIGHLGSGTSKRHTGRRIESEAPGP